SDAFVERWWRGEGSVEDRRLGALALIESGRIPTGMDALRVALRLAADDPLLGDAAVRDEWREALRPHEGDWWHRVRSLLVDPARAAFDGVFRRGESVVIGTPIDRARLE